MKGANLLAMVEEPKARFGDGDVERLEQRKQANPKGYSDPSGSALMDFFVDPTEIFASERHPALKEVLAVLSKSKAHRGIGV